MEVLFRAPHLATIAPDEVTGAQLIPGGPGGGEDVGGDVAAIVEGGEEISADLEFFGFDPVLYVAFLIHKDQIAEHREGIGVQGAEQPGEGLAIHGNDIRGIGAFPVGSVKIMNIRFRKTVLPMTRGAELDLKKNSKLDKPAHSLPKRPWR